MPLKTIFYLSNYILFGIAAYFIYSVVKDAWPALMLGPSLFNLKYLLFAIISMLLYWSWQVMLWRSIFATLGTELSISESSYLFFSNGLLAFIPGKIANLIGMASVAGEMRISKINTISVVLLFQIYALISGTGIIFLSGFYLEDGFVRLLPDYMMNLIGIATIIGLLMISPFGINFTQFILKNLISQELPADKLGFRKSLRFIFLYGIGWLIQSLVVWLIFKSFISTEQILPYSLINISFITSYLTSLLVIFVPSGLGIMEAGLILFLEPLLLLHDIIYSTVSFRIIAIGSVSILFTFFWAFRKFKQ